MFDDEPVVREPDRLAVEWLQEGLHHHGAGATRAVDPWPAQPR
ncbi:hypothetical protein [Streptomyces sp. NPDC093990]